jgi:hypothetical protein
MAYDNLTNITTSVSGTWGSSGFNYSALALDNSVPHIDQIQVERIFTITAVDSTKIDPYDLHRIFLINKSELTVNQNSTTITAISFSGTKTYTLTKGILAGTVITIPAVSSGQNITVRRKTFSAGTYVSWIPGSRLTSTQLNHQITQLLKINQELIYKLETEYVRTTDLTNVNTIQFTYGQDLVMNNNKIVSLGAPVSATDAATKKYVDDTTVSLTDTETIAGAKTFTSNVTAPTFVGNLSGNATTATTATTLATARTINGTSFDGSANITVTAAAGLLTGTTLNTTVIASSLTSVGNLSSLTVTGAINANGGVVGNLTGNASTATTATTVTGATQSAITSVGTLSNLTVSGTTTVPNVKITGTASADVNTLDAYEEGTFTPRYQYYNGTSWVDVTATYDIQVGKYTKIGNVVYCSIRLRTSTATTVAGNTANYLAITNLPFTPNSNTLIASPIAGYIGGFSGIGGVPTGIYSESGTRVYLTASSATANAVTVDVRAITAGASSNQIWTSFWYQI